jgi:hypothetical protein
MKIRIGLPENRDYAGRLEVLDASGAVVFGPIPAAGRAHDELAAGHGNVPRNPLRPYGDTPLGTYTVRGVVESAVVLEPASGQAALADAHGRFRFFIQGGGGDGGDDGGLPATAGGVRLHDRDLEQLLALVRRASGRVHCEIVTTAEQGAKVSLAQLPLDRDPPPLPAPSHVSTRPSADAAPPARTASARAARYVPRMFVVPERSGAGSTVYGAGGGDTGAAVGLADTGIPDVGPLPTGGVDVAPTPGEDLNPPLDETGVTIAESGGSQLLSTAAPTGLSSPYASDQGGWIVNPQPNDPFSDAPATANLLVAYTIGDVDTYSGGQPDAGNANAYTDTQAVDPYSNAIGAEQTGGGQVAARGTPPSDQVVDIQNLEGLTPVGTSTIHGVDYAHYQVTLDGVAYDAYTNDIRYPSQAFLIRAAAQPGQTTGADGAGADSAAAPRDAAAAVTPAPAPSQNYTPATSPGQNFSPASDPSVTQQHRPGNFAAPPSPLDDLLPWNQAAMAGAVSSQAHLPNYEARGGVAAYARDFVPIQQNKWQGYLGETSFAANSLFGGAFLTDLNTRPYTTARGVPGNPGFFPVFDYWNWLTRRPISVTSSSDSSQQARLNSYLDKYRQMVGAKNPGNLNTAATNLGRTPQYLAQRGVLVVNADDVAAARNYIAQDIRTNPGDYPAGWNPDAAANRVASNGQTTNMFSNQKGSRPWLNSLTEDQINRLMSPDALMVETRGWGGAMRTSGFRGAGFGAGVGTGINILEIVTNPDAHPDAAREVATTAALGGASGATGAVLENTFNAMYSRAMISEALTGGDVNALSSATTRLAGRSLGGAAGAGPAAAVFKVGEMALGDQKYTAEDYAAKGTRAFVVGSLSGALATGLAGFVIGSEVPVVGNVVGFAIGFLGYIAVDYLIGDTVEDVTRNRPEPGDYEPRQDPSGFLTASG